MATKFQEITLAHVENGSTVKGELVITSSTAYQVAVGGKVRSYMRDEWRQQVSASDWSNLANDSFFDNFGR